MNDKDKTQIGATLPLVVFALTALLGMAALAIDLSVMELARQRAQNVADAAALAGAQNPGSESSAAASVTAANNSVGSALQGETVAVNSDSSVTVRGYVNA
ncbi:MAG: pilus assembly protein TadG-related protein, partial [Armatimonadota bacterium]|nr:pilus assembly protein TadG-related protein [Armatimonadota bacterium]